MVKSSTRIDVGLTKGYQFCLIQNHYNLKKRVILWSYCYKQTCLVMFVISCYCLFEMIILLLDGVPCHMTDTAENYTNLDNSMLLLVVASFTFIKVMLF